VDGDYASLAGARRDADRSRYGIAGPLRLGVLRIHRRSLPGSSVGPGALPATGPVLRYGLRSDERSASRGRSGGRHAVVVVCLRGATGHRIWGIHVLPGPADALANENAMSRSLCETCCSMREVVTPKGSRFLLCQLSQTDPKDARYPPQPVLQCDGCRTKEQTEGTIER
jgi:hypothetical protein